MAASPEEDEDRKWLDGWRAGDASALARLFDRHADGLARYLARRVSGGDAATIIKDLIHRTFITLQNSRSPVEYNVRAFIHGIAHNELRHHYRDRKREAKRHEEIVQAANSGILPSPGLEENPDPEIILGSRQMRRLIGKALRRLDLDDQVILELHYWEERSRAEIAAILGIPAGTTAGRLNAARERLAEKFSELNSLSCGQETSKAFSVWLGELTQHLEVMRTRAAKTRAMQRTAQ